MRAHFSVCTVYIVRGHSDASHNFGHVFQKIIYSDMTEKQDPVVLLLLLLTVVTTRALSDI